MNFGVHTAWRKARDRNVWHHCLVSCQYGDAPVWSSPIKKKPGSHWHCAMGIGRRVAEHLAKTGFTRLQRLIACHLLPVFYRNPMLCLYCGVTVSLTSLIISHPGHIFPRSSAYRLDTNSRWRSLPIGNCRCCGFRCTFWRGLRPRNYCLSVACTFCNLVDAWQFYSLFIVLAVASVHGESVRTEK